MEYMRLSDCAEYRSDRTDMIDYDTYITTDNMLPNRGGITGAESLPDVNTVCKYVPDDILLSNIRPYFKKIWLANREGGCSNDVLVVKAKDTVLPKFLYYVLSDNNFFNYDNITSKGTKMPRGTPPAIMKYLVPNFCKDKQRKIVSILSAYDDLIVANNKRIKVLEQMAENLYKEWFARFRFPGHENAEFENGLPKGWRIEKVGTICDIITGKKDANEATGNGKYPFFTCARETTLSTDEYILDTDAILISGNGSYTGLVKKYSGKFDLYQRTYALFNFVDIEWLYLYWTFKNQFEREYMGGSHGSAIPYITKPNIEKFRIIIPTLDLQKRSQELFERIHNECIKLEEQTANLIQQRDLLLPRLMSGKIILK